MNLSADPGEACGCKSALCHADEMTQILPKESLELHFISSEGLAK